MPILVLILGAVLWGLTWYPLKHFNAAGIAGVPLVLVAYGSVGVLTAPALWRQRRRWRGEGRLLLWLGLAGGYANLAFAASMVYGEVVRAMMLFYLAPVWGVLGARLLLGETLGPRRWLGVALALAGAFLVLGGPALWRQPLQPVDLLALSAGFAFAMSNVGARAAEHLPEASKLAAIFVGTGLVTGAVMLGSGQSLPAASATLYGGLLLFGLLWLLTATLASVWAVGRLGAARASVILTTELVAAVVSATLIGGEILGWKEAVGGILIVTATLLEVRRDG